MPVFHPNPVYLFIRGAFRRFFHYYGSWNVVGREHIPSSGPGIVISNHCSYLDPPLMGCAVPRPIAYMAKQELFRIPVLSWVCRKLESYPVRQNTVDREALKETYRRLQENWLVGIFPEGHRSEDAQLHPFEPGIGMIALHSRAPVIPCAFTGTFEMMPPHSRRLHRSHIEVHFGPALELDDVYRMDDRKAAMAEVQKRGYDAVSSLLYAAGKARENWYTRKGR